MNSKMKKVIYSVGIQFTIIQNWLDPSLHFEFQESGRTGEMVVDNRGGGEYTMGLVEEGKNVVSVAV